MRLLLCRAILILPLMLRVHVTSVLSTGCNSPKKLKEVRGAVARTERRWARKVVPEMVKDLILPLHLLQKDSSKIKKLLINLLLKNLETKMVKAKVKALDLTQVPAL